MRKIKEILALMIWTFTITLVELNDAFDGPFKFIGMPIGQMLRCDIDKLDVCSVFNQAGSGINSLSVNGEYVFAGLNSGTVWRCKLHQRDSCTDINFLDKPVRSVLAHGQYLYVGNNVGTMLRCSMTMSRDCTTYNQGGTPVRAMVAYDEFIYVGLESGTFWRCRLDRPHSCFTLNVANSSVNALAIVGTYHIYAGLASGTLWMCSLHDQDMCEEIYKAETEINALDFYDKHLNLALNNGKILRCDLENNECWLHIDMKKTVLSLASIYPTVKINQAFVGENENCVWQPPETCPPFMFYYNIDQRYSFELTVKNGRVYNYQGRLYDTSRADRSHSGRKALFIMEPGGRIYVMNYHPFYVLHHSSLIAGNPVAAAGEIHMVKGIIKNMTSCSGHYKTPFILMDQVIKSLKIKGYEAPFTLQDCDSLQLEIPLDYSNIF